LSTQKDGEKNSPSKNPSQLSAEHYSVAYTRDAEQYDLEFAFESQLIDQWFMDIGLLLEEKSDDKELQI